MKMAKELSLNPSTPNSSSISSASSDALNEEQQTNDKSAADQVKEDDGDQPEPKKV
jgi:hypothetical protein